MSADLIAEFVKLLPEHKATLHLEHNPHKAHYETVAYYVEKLEMQFAWVSDAEALKAVGTGELWVLQWYPETPVGFNMRLASTLEALFIGRRTKAETQGNG